MERAKDKVTQWLTDMILAAIFLTPLLALLKVLLPIPIPWGAVLIPWIGTIHLLVSWFAGQMIAWMLFNAFLKVK